MGLISSVVYFSALPDSKPRIIFANSMVLATLQSLLVLPLGFLLLPWLLSSQTQHVIHTGRLFLLVIPISLAAQYGVSILQGRLHMGAFNFIRTIIPIGYLIGVIVFKALGRLTLLDIIVLHLGLQLLGLIATLVALWRSGIGLSLRADLSLAKPMLKFGRRVQLGDASQLANMRLDQALMAGLLPPAQLGIYVVAVSAGNLSQILSTTVRMVITPSIAQKDTVSERVTMLQQTFRKYLAVSFVATLIISLVLPLAIPLVYGSAFRSAIWPAEVLLVGAFLTGAKEVLVGGAHALGDAWLGSSAEVVALIITLILLPILLMAMGILGAAIAVTAAYATQFIMLLYGLNRRHTISPRALFGPRRRDLIALPGNG
jgi:O-antigen/teichoic acid export membrane protein